MDKARLCAALAPTLMLIACGETQTPQAQQTPTPTASPANETALAPLESPMPVANETDAPPLVPELTPEAERTETGARNLLLGFARAIELRQFGNAWTLLSPADQRKWSRAAFTEMFADLGKIIVAVPIGEMEGAAGSSYYTAPITITASEKNGRPVRYEGEAVLRRVNDVEGATPAQLRWHFETLTLDWTH